jgi:tetratricopeptide (TPR) repeat protein
MTKTELQVAFCEAVQACKGTAALFWERRPALVERMTGKKSKRLLPGLGNQIEHKMKAGNIFGRNRLTAINPVLGKIVLTCIAILSGPIAAWCQLAPKEQFNLTPNGQNAITYTLRANAEEKKGDLNAAMADCNTAIKFNPQYAGAYYCRGNVDRKKGDLGAALADYDQAIKLAPKFAPSYVDRGTIKHSKGDLDGALADYNQALKLSPRYAMAYNNRGNIKLQKNDVKGAMADFNQAIQLNPQFGLAYRNRGRAHQKMGDSNAAIADFNRAIKLGVNSDF